MRPLVAHCHFGLGKLYRSLGKGQDASEHLTTASMLYRAMDMHFWLDQIVALASSCVVPVEVGARSAPRPSGLSAS